ncbi:hydrophobic/amphiphilic exporter-1, HAE1 family [Kytococcus aerolatus]|uniref:Hydrophobic/amphiphilic exporter-1, HAE1 family n=1 Tax=Kytococcus aerolatus TaxID=592308 RepID=A0A212TZ50_9MICO|nr:efflux RND transporter permease subunit [Kytococcus aerolatus]SNC71287.1 hydrophobic/amphiphilic exporter-1, HAE1 family [Kytococcus aerolatus]
MTALSRLSLRNRALVALAAILTIITGLFSTTSLKQELLPSLEFPLVVAATPVPGADSEVVESRVTVPVEQAADRLDGVKTIESTSSAGMSMVQVELEYGTSLDDAKAALSSELAGLDLPEGSDPQVIVGAFDAFPIMQVSATGDTDARQLATALEEKVVPELEKIRGVREVQLSGAPTERVEIQLDQEKAAQAGITPQTITTALQSNGVVVPAGSLTDGDTALQVQVGSGLKSLDELRSLPLAATPATGGTGGQDPTAAEGAAAAQQSPAPQETPAEAPTLEEVAEVTLETPPATGHTRTDGRDALTLGIVKTPDGNTVAISNAVEEKLDELDEQIGEGGELTVVFDQAPFIEQSIHDLTTEGLLGLGFAILVVLVFLLSVRLTLVTAVSIPLSLLMAMIGLHLAGYSLNILTLGALTIAIGRVVDDSIVVIENIKRHVDGGEPKGRAIPRAVGEVAGAVTSSTLATAAVFLPLGLVGGQVGELFRPFALTVVLAMLASLLVALTIIPVLGYWLLGRPQGDRAAGAADAAEHDAPDVLQRAYLPVLRGVIRRPLLTCLGGLLVFAATIASTSLVKTDFLGAAGDDQLIVAQELPAGTTLKATDDAARALEKEISALDGVETVTTTVGDPGDGSTAFMGGGATSSQLFVSVADDTDAEAVRAQVEEAATEASGQVTVSGASEDPSADRTSIVVRAADDEALGEGARALEKAVREVEGAEDVTNNVSDTVPSVRVTVDREAALAAGLPEAALGQLVAGALSGSPVGQVTLASEQHEVVLQQGTAPKSVAALRRLPVGADPQGPVTLGDVSTVEEVESPVSITRTDGERSATIEVSNGTDDLGTFSAELAQAVDGTELPDGVEASLGGASSDQEEAFSQLGLAMLAAVGIVYLIMVGTFRSLVQPLILLVSIPFAATGAIALLVLTQIPLGVAGMIGGLMLVGIVVTNAIVLIDLVNQYRERGLGIDEAVLEGGRHRLRPILMTALATICALLPMAMKLTGGGAFISQPLAIVVIGGLVSSTLLTLVLVPALYVLVERLAQRFSRGEPEPAGAVTSAPAAGRGATSISAWGQPTA